MAWCKHDRELWEQHLLIKSLYGRSESKENSKRVAQNVQKIVKIPKMHKQARLTAYF